MKKIILLNAGSRTQRSFRSGISTTDLQCYKTKKMVMHIHHDLHISFHYQNEEITFDDAYVFTRLRADDSHFCGILYEHFADLRIPASDPINRSYRLSEEKIAQMGRLARAAIRIPETLILREEAFENNTEYIRQHVTFPCVFKTDGSQGRAVFKIDSFQALEEKMKEKKPHELCIIQEYIPNTFDTRTLVAYGRILGTIKRTAAPGNFHNNVSQGGSVAAYTLTEAEARVAIEATKVCKMDFGGVDIIHTPEGPVILEVNKSPQINGFEQIYGRGTVFATIARIITEEMI